MSCRRQLALRVTDDGPGIPAGCLPHIFDKFVKGDEANASGADGSQGTGLGLAIAKGIMEAHGGAIAAESPVAERPWRALRHDVSRAERRRA